MILRQISFDVLVMIVIILQGYMAKPNNSYLFSLPLQSLLLHLVCRHLFNNKTSVRASEIADR